MSELSIPEMKDFLKGKIDELTFTEVTDEELLWDTGILDSITIVELASEIEDEYGVSIPFDDIIESNFGTVNLLCDFITLKVKSA